MIKQYINGSWVETELQYNIKILDASLLPSVSHLIIHNGDTPIHVAGIDNLWLDTFNNQLKQWSSTLNNWKNVSSSVAEVLFAPQKEIGGVPVPDIMNTINESYTNSIQLLDSISTSKAVLDGSINIFSSSDEPIDSVEGDLWINGTTIKKFINAVEQKCITLILFSSLIHST